MAKSHSSPLPCTACTSRKNASFVTPLTKKRHPESAGSTTRATHDLLRLSRGGANDDRGLRHHKERGRDGSHTQWNKESARQALLTKTKPEGCENAHNTMNCVDNMHTQKKTQAARAPQTQGSTTHAQDTKHKRASAPRRADAKLNTACAQIQEYT